MDILICPTCEISLSPLRIPQGNIWQCPTCNGVMANIAVLRRYLSDNLVQNFWRKAIAGSTTAERKCPSCRQPLSSFKVNSPKDSSRRDEKIITLDICQRCQLIWFDKGELDAFPKAKISAIGSLTGEELSPKAKRELAMLQIEFENQLQDEMTSSEHAVMNVVDIIIFIIRLIATFIK